MTAKANKFLVINPGSGNGRSRQLADHYRKLLLANEQNVDSAETTELSDAAFLTKQAISSGYKTIVAIGGDGTISQVINGFMTSPQMESPPVLAVLYSGTSPDFCRFHGLATNPQDAVNQLLIGRSRPIDIGRIRSTNVEGKAETSYFGCSANIGLGAGIASRANRLRKYLGDKAGTFLATIATIAACPGHRFRLRLDDEVLDLPQVINITVGKNPFLAGGLKLSIDIAPDDGSLFVFALTGIGRIGLLSAIHQIYSGSIAGDPRFLLRRAKRVGLETIDSAVQSEQDGDPAGWCPVEIEIVPRAIELLGVSDAGTSDH